MVFYVQMAERFCCRRGRRVEGSTLFEPMRFIRYVLLDALEGMGPVMTEDAWKNLTVYVSNSEPR